MHLAYPASLEALHSNTQIESFRFYDENDYEYEIFLVLTRAVGSLWRENVVAVVILLRVLARVSYWREQVIKY